MLQTCCCGERTTKKAAARRRSPIGGRVIPDSEGAVRPPACVLKQRSPQCLTPKTTHLLVQIVESDRDPRGQFVRLQPPRCSRPRCNTMSDPMHTSPSSSDGAHTERLPDAPPPATAEKPEAPKEVQNSSNPPATDFKTLTDRVLHFLATASNEALGACLIGLSASTYLLLGRVGLLLIGIAGGVVLHATWEGQARGSPEEQATSLEARRRELGADVARRVLDWRSANKESSQNGQSDLDVQLYSGKRLDYSDFKPETAAALTELTDAVIRDYVK